MSTCIERLRSTTAICLIFNFMILITIVSLFSVMKGRQTQTSEIVEDGICERCERLGSEDNEMLSKLKRRREGKTEYCCAYDSEQLSSLLDLRRENENRRRAPTDEKIDLEASSLDSASAHKVLGYRNFHISKTPKFYVGPKGDLVFEDEEKFKSLEHSYEVEVLPSGYGIQRPGLYYVYNSLHYVSNSDETCADFPSSIWNHTVIRVRPSEPKEGVTLLSAVHTCPGELKMNSHTTYTGGLFYLEVGDVIKAETPVYGKLEYTGESNFLGLFLIGAGRKEDKTIL